jgi:hypothetical protein
MKTRIAGLLALSLLVGGPSIVKAETARQEFKENHPRRAQINKRIHNQRRRIRKEVREGDITKAQGKADNQALNAVKSQEVQDVKQNGGSLTNEQQRQLNKDLNGNSQNIGK